MFDIRSVNTRYFGVTLYVRNDITDEVEKTLEVNVAPPKLKVLKKVTSLGKTDEESDIIEAVSLILNSNAKHTRVPEEFIEDLKLNEMITFLNEFFKWINDTHKSKN